MSMDLRDRKDSQERRALIKEISNTSTLVRIDDTVSEAEEWSSSYSSSGSGGEEESNSTDSYIPDWEQYINSDGSLFYIEYNLQTAANIDQQKVTNNSDTNSPGQSDGKQHGFNRVQSVRRSKKTSGKLSKLIMNRNAKQKQNQTLKSSTTSSSSSSAATPLQSTDGLIKEIQVLVDPSLRLKYGRRASVTEAILGLSICSFPPPDGIRIMICGHIEENGPQKDKQIKIGDWLRAVNNQEVTINNIETILMSFSQPTEVKLTIQRDVDEQETSTSATTVVAQQKTNKLINLNDLLIHANSIFSDGDTSGSGVDVDGGNNDRNRTPTAEPMTFSVMYLTMDLLDENDMEGQDVLFCYPVKELNCLYPVRGSFLTLNSILNTTFNEGPTITTVKLLKDTEYHISYTSCQLDLLLVAISAKYATVEEVKLKTNEIIRYMQFLYQTLPLTFVPKNFPNLQTIFSLLSKNYQLKRLSTTMSNGGGHIRNVNVSSSFETALLEAHFIALPKEAQLRIDDALAEMEAMDYREWNDEPLKSQREFYIVGSALYYRKYLLANHLPVSDLLDLQAFLRIECITWILENRTLSECIIWREIYPKSVERGLVQSDKIYGIPKGRWFLGIVARNHMLIAVILESLSVTSSLTAKTTNAIIAPSPFYVEEIQDALEHIRGGGLENLVSTWIHCNKRPQIITDNKENLMKTSASTSNISNTSPVSSSSVPNKKSEIISILKRRQSSTENVTLDSSIKHNTSIGGGSSVNSQTLSDDSNHKFSGGGGATAVDDDSDSDWDGFPDSHRSSSGAGFDMSDMTDVLLKEVSDVIPSKITAGKENVLFHYVQLEIGEGILLAPSIGTNEKIIWTFQNTCLLIHSILQNSVRLMTEDKSKSHKSLVPVKEYGHLIHLDLDGDGVLTEFWVIGRLFAAPAKELYVCHRADVPQNLIELAFRISLNTTG